MTSRHVCKFDQTHSGDPNYYCTCGLSWAQWNGKTETQRSVPAGVSHVRPEELREDNPGRCTAIYPGSWPKNARCERWAEHESQHAINIWLGEPILWKDCVPCGHCGEPIYEDMIPGRFTHFRSELKACGLCAEPEPRNIEDEIRRHRASPPSPEGVGEGSTWA